MFPALLADRIHPTRQEVFFFGAPAGECSFTAPKLPTWIDFKDEAYGLPDLEGRGVKIAIDRHGPRFDPENGSRVVTAEGLLEVRQYLARRLPELKNAPVTETRVCQYENTSNGDFLIDLHPDLIVSGGLAVDQGTASSMGRWWENMLLPESKIARRNRTTI